MARRRPTFSVGIARPSSTVNLSSVNNFRMNGLLPNGCAIDEHCIGMLLRCSCLLTACMAVPLRVTIVTLP